MVLGSNEIPLGRCGVDLDGLTLVLSDILVFGWIDLYCGLIDDPRFRLYIYDLHYSLSPFLIACLLDRDRVGLSSDRHEKLLYLRTIWQQ